MDDVYFELEDGTLQHSGAKYSDYAGDFGRASLTASAIKLYHYDNMVIFFPNMLLVDIGVVSNLEDEVESLKNVEWNLESELDYAQEEIAGLREEIEKLEAERDEE